MMSVPARVWYIQCVSIDPIGICLHAKSDVFSWSVFH